MNAKRSTKADIESIKNLDYEKFALPVFIKRYHKSEDQIFLVSENKLLNLSMFKVNVFLIM